MDKDPLGIDNIDIRNGYVFGQNLVKVRSMTTIVTILCVRFCPDKDFLSAIYCLVLKYLSCSNAGIYSQVRRASLERKLHERRPFYTKCNGGPDGKHCRMVRSWQVAFKSKSIPALLRCPSSKINNQRRLHLHETWRTMWFFLVCSIIGYGECTYIGELSLVAFKKQLRLIVYSDTLPLV